MITFSLIPDLTNNLAINASKIYPEAYNVVRDKK